MWIRKAQVAPYKVRFIRFVVKPLISGFSGVELDWILKEFGDQSGDLGALGSGQGDMGKEWVALQGFDNSDHAVVATDAEVVALGNVMGEDNS